MVSLLPELFPVGGCSASPALHKLARPVNTNWRGFSQLRRSHSDHFSCGLDIGFPLCREGCTSFQEKPLVYFLGPLPCHSPSSADQALILQNDNSNYALLPDENVFLALTQHDVFYTESCLNCCCLNQNSLELKMSSRNFSFDVCEASFFFILNNFIHTYNDTWSYLPLFLPFKAPQNNPRPTLSPALNNLLISISTLHMCMAVEPSSGARETIGGHTFQKEWSFLPQLLPNTSSSQ